MDTTAAFGTAGLLTMDRHQKTSVVLIDPRPFTRACTSAGLVAAPDFQVHAFDRLAAAGEIASPDLVLLQHERAADNAATLTEDVRDAMRRWPGALILVVTPDDDAERLLEALQCGVRGVLTTDTNLQAVISTIRLLMADLVVFPRAAINLIRSALSGSGEDAAGAAGDEWAERDTFSQLTPRQQEVVRLLALGMSNRAIANLLNISESTVKVHIRSVMTQTGVSNRTQIVAQFMSHLSQT